MTGLLRTVRSGLVVAATAAAAGDPALEPRDEAAAPFQPGTRGSALTVLRGTEVQEIPLSYVGTYRDVVAPGYDVHLVELEGPAAAEFGVAAGMSGSPVYLEGKLVGALAFRLGFLPKTALAGVTPIEKMLEAARSEDRAPPLAGAAGFAPIATPVLVGGMPAAVRAWLSPELERLGFVLVPGGGAGRLPIVASELRPGSPVGAQLVRGDQNMTATGTVTFVDGERVFAFGHPFLGAGRVELPMVSAEVITTLADLAGSMKLTNVGSEVGAIVADRQGALVGRIGQRARMARLDLALRGADYGDRRYHFEIVSDRRLTPVLAGAVVAGALHGVGFTQESTLLVAGRVRLAGTQEVVLERAFSSDSRGHPGIELATDLLITLAGLGANPFDEARIESLTLEIDARAEPVSYTIEDVQYDRGMLDPGQGLRVRCALRRYRGATIVREIDVPLPDRLEDWSRLELVVGNPAQVDRLLGAPVAARLSSAVDLDSAVRALAELGGANRLQAVVFRAGGAVVARGETYSELPPTAERLLATQVGSPRARATQVSTVARGESVLDGPVRGGVRLRLRVDREDRGGSSR